MILPSDHIFAGLPGAEVLLDGRVTLFANDCIAMMAHLPEASIDACVVDPPYHLTSIVKRFSEMGPNDKKLKMGRINPYQRTAVGFMNQKWDGGYIAFRPETWAAVYRVLKPGAHLVAFGGDRTFHRLACAIEDAGFEIRGTIAWIFGQGFPKNLNVTAKLKDSLPADALCVCTCDCPQTIQDFQSDYPSCRDYDDGQLLAGEDAVQDAFPSQDDALAHSRLGQRVDDQAEEQANIFSDATNAHHASDGSFRLGTHPLAGCQESDNIRYDRPSNMLHAGSTAVHRNRARKSGTSHSDDDLVASTQYVNLPQCSNCGKYKIADGLGTALKPAMELICLARKPLVGTVAENVLAHRTGALNIDGCRVESVDNPMTWETPRGGIWATDSAAKSELKQSDKGRWPANVIHDGSPEVVEAFPETASGTGDRRSAKEHGIYGAYKAGDDPRPFDGDSGSAARFFKSFNGRDGEVSAERRYTEEGSTNFAALPGARRDGVPPSRIFYTSKADSDDRLGSKHPTVKPLDLMQWLVRLVTPPGGTVLDCFAGTGTTAEAAFREGMRAVLIEAEPEYQHDIRRRMALVLAGPDERMRESIKARGMVVSPGPLFESSSKPMVEAAE